MAAWLEIAPNAFDRALRPVADALFSVDAATGLDGVLFDADGEPTPDAVAPLTTTERAGLEGERAALLARLSEIDAKLSA